MPAERPRCVSDALDGRSLVSLALICSISASSIRYFGASLGAFDTPAGRRSHRALCAPCWLVRQLSVRLRQWLRLDQFPLQPFLNYRRPVPPTEEAARVTNKQESHLPAALRANSPCAWTESTD